MQDNEYFSNHYKLIPIDLSKQNELENCDLSQKINFIDWLDEENVTSFFIIEKTEEATFNFSQNSVSIFHKIINLLNDSSNEESKFPTKKCYAIDSQTAKGKDNENNSIKFETGSINSIFCNYSDAFILVPGDITINPGNDTSVASKNCPQFSTCKTKTNDQANHIYIAMPM